MVTGNGKVEADQSRSRSFKKADNMVKSAAQVFETLEKFGLLGTVDLENARKRWNKPDRPHLDSSSHCLKWLVTNQFITAFQGEQILAGRSESLRLNEFVVRERVVDGPFAGSYVGHDTLNRQVVIQFGQKTEGGAESKSTELPGLRKLVDRLSKIENNHIQKPVNCGIHEGRPFIVWQWWEGCSLTTAMAKRGKVDPHKACKIFATVLAAAQSLHESGLPVGKVDLNSIFLAIEPGKSEGRVVKILKAGIGSDWDHLKNAGNPPDHPEEVYCIGKAMYQAVTGSGFPEGGNSRSTVAPLMPDLPEFIADFVDQLTNPNPEIRFPDAKVAGKALRILIATDEGDGGQVKGQDPLNELTPLAKTRQASGAAESEDDEEVDWFSTKINKLLEKVGISPRELIFLSTGALATVMLLLLGLWLVGDIMPLIALGLGAMGGYYLNAWLAKKAQAE